MEYGHDNGWYCLVCGERGTPGTYEAADAHKATDSHRAKAAALDYDEACKAVAKEAVALLREAATDTCGGYEDGGCDDDGSCYHRQAAALLARLPPAPKEEA